MLDQRIMRLENRVAAPTKNLSAEKPAATHPSGKPPR